jgi:hypothetical protein
MAVAAAGAAPHVYLHNIPSVLGNNPGLPHVLADVDLDRAILAGEGIVQEHLTHAKGVADLLKGARGTVLFQHQSLIVLKLYRA